MKLQIIYVIAILLIFTGCEEVGPSIDLANGFLEDTTYVAPVEPAQPKKVLIEEFTGVSCPPCPSGHTIVKAIKSQHPDRIIVIAYHVMNFPQAEPVHGLSKQDFRTQDATDVGNTIYGGVASMPTAGIDRVAKNNQLLQARGIWPTSATEQAAKGSFVNIHLERTFDDATSTVSLLTKVAFTQNIDKKMNLNVAIIEDSLVDAQKNDLKTDTFYVHNYVLRDMVTPTFGTAFLEGNLTKEAGRVYERKFSFPVNKDWDLKKCKIVVFVALNEQTEKEVIQVSDIKLTE